MVIAPARPLANCCGMERHGKQLLRRGEWRVVVILPSARWSSIVAERRLTPPHTKLASGTGAHTESIW
jgi:hypothetical protein